MKDGFLVEFIGSFVITFFGAFIRINNVDDFVSISIGYLLLYLGICYCSKNHSSGHFNPILTLSLLFTSNTDKRQAGNNILGQLLGSVVGGAMIWTMRKTFISNGDTFMGEPIINRASTLLGAGLEALAMFILVWVYNTLYCQIDAPKQVHGAAIASVYGVFIGAIGMFSGGCLNLVSLIGPSLMNQNFQDWANYILGQLTGGILGAIFYDMFLKLHKGEDPYDSNFLNSKEKVN